MLGLRYCRRGVDQPDVAEGLGKVAEQLAGIWVDLLGEEADIIEVRDGTLEDVPCPTRLVSQSQGMCQPERAQHEHALAAGQTILAAGFVAVDQPALVG